MTFEPEAFDRCVELVKNSSKMWCSPYYSEPHSKTCEVCNMDKNLYDLVLEHIDNEKHGEKNIDIPFTDISLTFRAEKPEFGQEQQIWIEVFERGSKVAEIKRRPDGSIKRY